MTLQSRPRDRRQWGLQQEHQEGLQEEHQEGLLQKHQETPSALDAGGYSSLMYASCGSQVLGNQESSARFPSIV